MFFGLKPSKVATVKQINFEWKGTLYAFEALIKQTRELTWKDLDTEENRPQLIQILNISLKNSLKGADMV